MSTSGNVSRLISPQFPPAFRPPAPRRDTAEAVALIHIERPFAQVAACVIEIVHIFVADETQPGRVIDESEDELGIVERETAQDETVGFEYVHARIMRERRASGWDRAP